MIADENGNHTVIEDIINNGILIQRSMTFIESSGTDATRQEQPSPQADVPQQP